MSQHGQLGPSLALTNFTVILDVSKKTGGQIGMK